MRNIGKTDNQVSKEAAQTASSRRVGLHSWPPVGRWFPGRRLKLGLGGDKDLENLGKVKPTEFSILYNYCHHVVPEKSVQTEEIFIKINVISHP